MKHLPLATLIVVSFCLNSVTAIAQATPRHGGTLILGLEANLPVFDPLTMGALVERTVAAAFYETLFELDEQGNLQPHLATSYSVSEDGKIYTIELREGINFHDGTPFNAEAVASNFNRLLDPQNSCRCIAAINFVEEVKASGPHTVKFMLRSPNAALIGLLADITGMQPSPSAIKKFGEKFAENPVGTGPFKFVKWDRGVALTVERNPDYWQKGRPYLDKIIYRPIPDTQTRMASLLAGDIDVHTVPAPEDIAAVKSGKRKFNLVEAPALGTVFTMFNLQRAPFDDVRVRQAIFHSIDRKMINDAINHGVYPLANNPYGEGLFGGELINDYPEFNPAKTRELLAAYGKPVKFELTIYGTPPAVRMAQVLQQMWKQYGIEVTIQQLDQLQLVGKALDSSFDAMSFRWSGRADPDLNTYAFFHSESDRNYTHYKNPKVDELLEQGRTQTDHQKRVAIYREVGDIIAQEGPYHFLWSQRYYFMTKPSVQGLAAIPGGIPRVTDVWLAP